MDEGVKECKSFGIHSILVPAEFLCHILCKALQQRPNLCYTELNSSLDSGLTLHMSTRSIKREKKISDNLGLLEPTKVFFVLNS